MQHSPEPWDIDDAPDYDYIDIIASNRFTVVQDDGSDIGIKRANFERIVACVNACAGIPNEDLPRIKAALAYCEGMPTSFLELHAKTREKQEQAK